MSVVPSGIISEPKEKLRDMLAECASVQALLAVGTADLAKAKIFTDYLFGQEEIALQKPFMVVTMARITLELMDVGTSFQLWPKMRPLIVQIFCDDPGNPKLGQNGVDMTALMRGTLSLENTMGAILWELGGLSGLDDRLAINRLDWSSQWLRPKPADWPSSQDGKVDAMTYFTVEVNE